MTWGYSDGPEVGGYAQTSVGLYLQIRVWHAEHWHQLTPPQRRILVKIFDILTEEFQPYCDMTPDQDEEMDEEERRYRRTAYRAYDKAILKAIRLGIRDHPLIQDWYAVTAGRGDRKTLRRPKMGLERGVEPPLPYAEAKLEVTIIDVYKTGKSLRKIHRTLQAQNAIRPMSWQARRLLTRPPTWGSGPRPTRPSPRPMRPVARRRLGIPGR